MDVFQLETTVGRVVFFALLAVKLFAFVSALRFSAEAYNAAGKLTKQAWCIILGLGVVIEFVPISILFLSIAFTIAAFVYLADVRPAVAPFKKRGGGRGSTNMGPYGPW